MCPSYPEPAAIQKKPSLQKIYKGPLTDQRASCLSSGASCSMLVIDTDYRCHQYLRRVIGGFTRWKPDFFAVLSVRQICHVVHRHGQFGMMEPCSRVRKKRGPDVSNKVLRQHTPFCCWYVRYVLYVMWHAGPSFGTPAQNRHS